MSSNTAQKSQPFHEGERQLQDYYGVREKMQNIGERVIRDYLTEQHQQFFSQLPFVVAGFSDGAKNPWASILYGEPGFIQIDSPTQITIYPTNPDTLVEQLQPGSAIGLLGIMFDSRRRNRLNGIVTLIDDRRITITITESFGNCPKYIQQREFSLVATPMKTQSTTGTRLTEPLLGLIKQSDTLFIASSHSDAAG